MNISAGVLDRAGARSNATFIRLPDEHDCLEGIAGFPVEMAEGRDNLVCIPAMKHRLIARWYQTPNKDYDYLSRREHLRGKSWEERRKIGLEALVRLKL